MTGASRRKAGKGRGSVGCGAAASATTTGERGGGAGVSSPSAGRGRGLTCRGCTGSLVVGARRAAASISGTVGGDMASRGSGGGADGAKWLAGVGAGVDTAGGCSARAGIGGARRPAAATTGLEGMFHGRAVGSDDDSRRVIVGSMVSV